MYQHQKEKEVKSDQKQMKAKAGIQRKNQNSEFQKELQLKEAIQRKPNNTGLPDHLKSGIENLSGHSMDDVKVHYNSSKPAQLNAHAYAQGNQIHLGGGQEKHLAHEAWHVVQQKQGRVKPTVSVNGAAVNDNFGLEKEADVMGGKALQMRAKENSNSVNKTSFGPKGLLHSKLNVAQLKNIQAPNLVIQRAPTSINYDTSSFDMENGKIEIVGKKMIANINPTDQVQGSAPGNGVQAELMQEFKNQGYKRMVRGHLMNGQLGGLGIAANLFPITSQANAKHKNHVENPIKDQIKRGKEISYEVTVISQNKMSDPDADFKCKAAAIDGTWSKKETISSSPGKTSVRGNNIEGNTNKGTSSMSFSTANLPKGFGERGRGFTGRDEHKKALGKSSVTFEGKKLEGKNKALAEGIHFNSGIFDQQEYALELIEKYDSEPGVNFPLYFNNIGYSKQEIEDLIDTSDESNLRRIIDRVKGML